MPNALMLLGGQGYGLVSGLEDVLLSSCIALCCAGWRECMAEGRG